LEETLRTRNTPTSLPVITLADRPKIIRNKLYGRRTAEKLMERRVDIEKLRGEGRLYIP
jgi:hypothetical protein